jgi:hypothetical protein
VVGDVAAVLRDAPAIPKGSMNWPKRSPQKVSPMGWNTSAPASNARCQMVSASSVAMTSAP